MASKDNWWLELKWGSEHSDLIQPMPCFKHELVDQQHADYNSLHRAVCIPRLFHVPQQFGYQHGPAQLRTLQPCLSNAIYEVEELDRGKLVDASQDHSGHIKECNGSLKELEYASKCTSNYGNYARSCRTDESNITSNVGDENCRSISSALCGSCEDVKKLSHLAAVACEVDSPAKRKPLKLRTEDKKAVKIARRHRTPRSLFSNLKSSSSFFHKKRNSSDCLMPSAVAARRKRLMPLNRIRSQETRVQRFAKNILQIIGEDTIAEKLIRAALGNSPDTSKALRLLLTQKRVLRYGNGGRGSPFMYSVTSEGRKELELIGQV